MTAKKIKWQKRLKQGRVLAIPQPYFNFTRVVVGNTPSGWNVFLFSFKTGTLSIAFSYQQQQQQQHKKNALQCHKTIGVYVCLLTQQDVRR